jgi:membrane associated rhomboid family serine protease
MERFRQSPVTEILLGINLALFFMEEGARFFFDGDLFPLLALSREGLIHGQWWQVVTHAFLHGNLLHLIVNMVALWFTGPLLEEFLGGWRYLILYFSGIVAGGLLQTFSSTSSGDLVGASGAVCALLVGFATLFPRLRITALIFFVIPVRMNAATLGWLVIGGSFLFWIFGLEQEVGHLAHLGGGVAGFLICRIYLHLGLVRSCLLPPPIPPPIPEEGK